MSVFVLAVVAVLSMISQAHAQVQTKLIVTTQPDGYARMILTFPKLPKYEVAAISGVLVLKFDVPIATVLDNKTVKAPEFILIGRADPDGKALRFALAQNVRINTMEAGEQLFIDLLPQDWQGVSPGLPPEVVAELARRAAASEREAEIEARRRALENSKYQLRIHVGQQPTFSRIVFDWGARVGVQLSRKGDVVTIGFDQLAKAPMERLKSDPPRFVKSAASSFDEEGLKISLTIEKGSDVRGFREENTYVVDISAPPGSVIGDNIPLTNITGDETVAEQKTQELVELNHDTSVEPTSETSKPGPGPVVPAMVEKPKPRSQPTAQPKAAMPAAPKPEKPAAEEVNRGTEAVDEVPEVVIGEFYLNADGTDLATAKEALGQVEATPPVQTEEDKVADVPVFGADPKSEEPAKEKDAVSVSAEPKKLMAKTDPVVAKAERDGKVLRITFPFAEATPAAVFRRAEVLWLVFETEQPVDVTELEKLEDDHYSRIKLAQSGSTRILRVYLKGNTVSSTDAEDNDWVLTLADTVITPSAPVSLKRGLRSDGRAKVTVAFQNASAVHQLKDPDVGDKLAVVTGLGPQRGVVKQQEFVEFTVLKTAHGLAVKPLADDVRVRLRDEEVLITRSGGLTLSSSRVSDLGTVSTVVSDRSRLGFVDFEGWSPGGPKEFMKRAVLLESAIGKLEPSQTLGPRLDLVRLYLANNLGGEALGQLKLIGETDPELKSEPMFAALRGVANVMMHRPHEARPDLVSFGLKDDPHTALWRGIMAVQESKWSEAAANFLTGEYAISEYPQEEQLRFRLAAMRAAIEMGDFDTGDFHFKLIPKIDLPSAKEGELQVLQGRLLDGLGRAIEGYELLEQALVNGDRKVEAEAMYYHALLGRRLGKLSQEQLQEKLESLAAIWRGDDLEINTLRHLAKIYVDQQKYRDALRVMKVAITNYPKAELTSGIHNDMTALFESLFLENKADTLKPVEALALYYEYRELTPVGRRGDEMIRHLADRLISVDLLDQAIEILSHQVDKRLIGSARAQVAAKLAMVYLMNRDPESAVRTIRRTRQAVLPQHIQSQRRLIEARALSELGRTEAAVELLAHMDDEAALRQRAEAYWLGERWQKSGEMFERVLGDAAQKKEALSALQRIDVLRAAISYVLADDKIGLDRLRERFEAKMHDTPDESAFKVVTRTVNRDSIAFRNLAKEIAATDTLESFIRKFRETFDAITVGADTTAQ